MFLAAIEFTRTGVFWRHFYMGCSQVPEPSTMLLFGSGLLLLGLIVHRKQLHAKTGNIGLIDVA